MSLDLKIDVNKTVLSGIYRPVKTERFLKQTNNFSDADSFISKIADAFILNAKKILALGDSFKVQTKDAAHAFFFCVRDSEQERYSKDIVFFNYSGREGFIRRGDPSLSNYLERNFTLKLESTLERGEDLKRLYKLSNSPKINFPLLNDEQKNIAAIEDKNVLVQGVAGSGKTNLCIDKIIFSASRGYRGRVLYSTYSRGLLIDTHSKIRAFESNLKSFLNDFRQGRVVFADEFNKKAIENKLGIYFSEDESEDIAKKIESIIAFLDNNVDYLLLEDLYAKYVGEEKGFADENWFSQSFVGALKNHQLLNKLDKAANLPLSVIYKEIYGVIFGCYDGQPRALMQLDEYIEKRSQSFTKPECELIHWLARDYDAYLKKSGLVDNNLISRALLEKESEIEKYSLVILDEVQDLTEINLFFFKSIAAKMFCVGDALQMINPSYFSFAYLKRLLFEKDVISVAELKSNYRSTKRIAELIERLGEMNVRTFGTHSFVLKTIGIDSFVPTSLMYLNDKSFLDKLKQGGFNNYTIIVSGQEQKEQLRQKLGEQEILTVSEIKGLERDVVVLYNVLSANADKWKALERLTLNRKNADENSVYRYYFNLFYVAISRGKNNIFVFEDRAVATFADFFRAEFEHCELTKALAALNATSDKTEAEQDELIRRIDEFVRLGQYENARFTAKKIINAGERRQCEGKIDIYASSVARGRYREAAIGLWELGLLADAKTLAELDGNEQLIALIDACIGKGNGELDIDVVRFLPDLSSNDLAKRVIFDIIRKDLGALELEQRQLKQKLSQSLLNNNSTRRRKNGQ